MRDIGTPNGIGGMGYSKTDIPDLVEGTLKQERLLAIAPRQPSEEDLTAIFTDSIENW